MLKKTSSPKKANPGRQESSHKLVKLCLVVGILMLVFLPVTSLKLAEWKLRHDQAKAAPLTLLPAETPAFGGPFKLINQDGVKVSDATFRGKYLLVYFGYTYCPDLCPTALQSITETLDALGPDADKVQALLITIDPERDTPEKLKEYTSSFHPNIMGLTGSQRQVAAAARAYNVTYAKGEKVDQDDYVMEHTTLVYLVDPHGKPITSIDMENVDPAVVAALLRHLWKAPRGEKK